MRASLPHAVTRASALVAAVGMASLVPRAAHAFCRTTTSGVPADYDPSQSGCWPYGYLLYWTNACVSYDIQKDASQQMSYDQASEGIAEAFTRWTSAACPDDDAGTSRVSIDVRDFGPVDCGTVEYNQYGPNQHTIVFRDTNWPYQDSSNTLALTTVTFDPYTGEIYDADMEINTAMQTLTPWDPNNPDAPIPQGGYDFLSIVTHETGHFLGMAHSDDVQATMYAHYTPGTTSLRLLGLDDIAGICSIYPPNGTRNASADAVPPDGVVPEGVCDATPRHGWTSECCSKLGKLPDGGSSGQCDPPSRCSVSRGAGLGAGGAGRDATSIGLALALGACIRRRPVRLRAPR